MPISAAHTATLHPDAIAELRSQTGRGGRLQRHRARLQLAAATTVSSQSCASPSEFDSELALHLLREWSWGKISAPEIQRIASTAFKDQVELAKKLKGTCDDCSKSLARLARLGSNGNHPGNAHRELLTWLGEPVSTKPLSVEISVVVQKFKNNRKLKIGLGNNLSIRKVPIHFMLPHMVFHNLFNNFNDKFKEFMFGCKENVEDQLESFWNTIIERGDPRLRSLPITSIEGWKRRCIPIATHGDGVPCIAVGKSGSRSFEIHSWSSILAQGPTAKIKQFIFGMFDHLAAKKIIHSTKATTQWMNAGRFYCGLTTHCSQVDFLIVIIWVKNMRLVQQSRN